MKHKIINSLFISALMVTLSACGGAPKNDTSGEMPVIEPASSTDALSEWICKIQEAQETLPSCKIAMIVDDENDPEMAEFVKKEICLSSYLVR